MGRSRWQTAAGIFAGLVAVGALVAVLSLLTGMQHLLQEGLEELGGDIAIAMPGHREAVQRWLGTGATDQPIPATIDVAQWRKRLKAAKVVGLLSSQGYDLAAGGLGEPSYPTASLLVVRLEFWAAPLMAANEISAAIPEADVIVGEQSIRHVLTDLQPLVRHLRAAAGVALLAAVLITGLLASIRVGERRSELGMLRAIGAPRRFMIALTLGESLALALTGGLAGLVIALGALWLAPLSGGLMRLLSPWELAKLGGLAMGATALAAGLAALGPALQTARLDPLDAVRRHG